MDINRTVKFKYITPEFTKSGKERIIEGYASTYDVDRQYEVITPEAMQKAVADLLTTNTTIFYEHKHEQFPVGRILDAKVDEKGLWIKVLISETANEVWTLIKEGILNKFSIGGKVIDYYKKFDKSLGRDITYITKMELYEVSVVGLPANQNASFRPKSLAGCIVKALEGRERLDGALQKIEGQGGAEKMAEEKKEEVKAEETKVEAPKVEPTVEKKEEVVVSPVETTVEKVETPTEEKKVEEPKPETAEVKKELTKEEVAKLVEKAAPAVPAKEQDAQPYYYYYDAQGKKKVGKKTEQKDQTTPYYYEQDVTAAIDELKAKLDEVLVAVKEIQAGMKKSVEVVPEVKKEEVPVQKSLTAEEVTTIVTKVFDEKVGKIRLVPSRKGTLIKTDLEIDGEKIDDSDLNVINDEGKFNKLPKEKQQDLIRKSLSYIITGK